MLRVCSPIETVVSSAMVPPTKTKPFASTARCMIGVRMLLVIVMVCWSSGRRLGSKALDAQAVDGRVGIPGGDQLRHHGAGPRSELKPVQREPELVEQALVLGARADDREVVLR